MSISKIFDESANLNEYPVNKQNSVSLPDGEYTIGDLHANAWLMLYFFQREGISSFDEETYQKLRTHYHTTPKDITRDTLVKYRTELNNTKFNPVKTIHFLGDTVSDRSFYGDHYILFNYEVLDRKEIPFDICISNHDLEFLIAYLAARKKSNAGNLDNINCPKYLESCSLCSTHTLIDLVQRELISKTEICNLVEKHYLPHLKLFSYAITAEGHFVLQTHASVDFSLIEYAAQTLKVNYRDESPQALARTIDAINDRFNKQYIQENYIPNLSHNSNDGMGYVLEKLTWNYKAGEADFPKKHRGYSILSVHGHRPRKETTHDEHIFSLDSNFGKVESYYTQEGQKQDKKTDVEHFNIGYRSMFFQSSDVADDTLELRLKNISLISQKLIDRYTKKIRNSADDWEIDVASNKIKIINQINTLAKINEAQTDAKKLNLRIREICKLYNENQDILEAEYDPTDKTLINALKIILVSLGLMVGIVPGLVFFGIFAGCSYNKTGSIDFLSREANKTSRVMELKTILTT